MPKYGPPPWHLPQDLPDYQADLLAELRAENARLLAELTEAQRVIRVARQRLIDANGRDGHAMYRVVLAVRQILRGGPDDLPVPPDAACARCGAALDNVAPGYSILAGGARVCANCIGPNDYEALRARGY